MPNVDQFESAFKSASKALFRYQPLIFAKVALVTDTDVTQARVIEERVRRFLGALGEQAEWLIAPAGDSETVEALLALVERQHPDLLITYRNLHSAAWQWPHSLGRHLDVLTQIARCPVMVIPHPNDQAVFAAAMNHTPGGHGGDRSPSRRWPSGQLRRQLDRAWREAGAGPHRGRCDL